MKVIFAVEQLGFHANCFCLSVNLTRPLRRLVQEVRYLGTVVVRIEPSHEDGSMWH